MRDYRAELEQEWIDGVERALDRGKKKFDSNFYVQAVNIKRTKEGQKRIAPVFFERESCPTPGYSEVVYKYYASDDRLEFLWSLPESDDCLTYYNNRAQVDPAEYCILEYVIKYYDGELFKLVDRMELEDGRNIH